LTSVAGFINKKELRLGALKELNREPRESRGWARRCNPALSRWIREPFQPCVPLFQSGNGKAAERAGKSEDLPECWNGASWREAMSIKIGG
jgi:hypothetical protein